MAWVKLDDRFVEDPRVVVLSDAAFRLHVTALCYCGRNETSGVFSPKALPNYSADAAAELRAEGLWQPRDNGHLTIRNFLKYNPSKELLRVKREQAAEQAKNMEAEGT